MCVFLFILLVAVISSQDVQGETIDYTQFGVDEDYSTSLTLANKLYKELFDKREYKKDLSPINGRLLPDTPPDKRFLFSIGLQSMYIIDLDSSRQVLSIYLEFEYKWRDVRLAWNETDYDGLNAIWVQCGSIWVPGDVVINANAIDDIVLDRFEHCKIFSNGSVSFDSTYNTDIGCTVNVGKFPFDVQQCYIIMESVNYDTYRVWPKHQLFTKYPNDTEVTYGNGEITITNVTAGYVDFNGNTVPELDAYGIGFIVTLKRQPAFYIYVITIPCFLLTFLSVIGCFWSANLKEEQLAKLSIALTSMMSMTTFVDMVSQQMPKNSQFPLLGIYVLTCVFITSACCVVLVSMPETPHRCKKDKEEPNLLMKIRRSLLNRHFLFLVLFQGANLVNIIVFLSFWD